MRRYKAALDRVEKTLNPQSGTVENATVYIHYGRQGGKPIEWGGSLHGGDPRVHTFSVRRHPDWLEPGAFTLITPSEPDWPEPCDNPDCDEDCFDAEGNRKPDHSPLDPARAQEEIDELLKLVRATLNLRQRQILDAATHIIIHSFERKPQPMREATPAPAPAPVVAEPPKPPWPFVDPAQPQ